MSVWSVSRKSLTGIAFFLMVFISFTCKKDRDKKDPVITFLQPAEGEIIRTDELEVVFHVVDDNALRYVRLCLVDQDLVPFTTPVFFYPKVNDTTISYTFLPENGLKKGVYDIQVLAEDSRNSKFKYRTVNVVTEVQLNVQVVYVSQAGQIYDVWRISHNGLHEKLFSQQQAIVQIASRRFSNIFYTLSDFPSKLQARSSSSGQLLWEKEASVQSARFNHMYLKDNYLLVSDASGTISMLNASTGSGLMTYHQQTDTIPEKVYFDDRFIYVANKLLSGGSYVLSLYHRATLRPHRRYQMPGKLQGILPYQENKVALVIENASGEVLIKSFDNETELFLLMGSINGHNIKQIKAFSDDELLFVSNMGVGLINIANAGIQMISANNNIRDAVVNFRPNILFTDGRKLYYHPTGPFIELHSDVHLLSLIYPR